MICSVENCGLGVHARGLCNTHYRRLLANGDTSNSALRRAPNGSGWNSNGYVYVTHEGERRPLHDVIAERAIGRRLRGEELVHHFNELKTDNRNENLVVCPDDAYHLLLHARARAMNACGNPNWRPCQFCKAFDAVDNLVKRRSAHHHAHCATAYERARQARRARIQPGLPGVSLGSGLTFRARIQIDGKHHELGYFHTAEAAHAAYLAAKRKYPPPAEEAQA